MLKQSDPQEELSKEVEPKEERSLFRGLIYCLLGLGLISLIATFVLALGNPRGNFGNIEPKNNGEKTLKQI